jgi:GNAT superfamily N-acetyltransferase
MSIAKDNTGERLYEMLPELRREHERWSPSVRPRIYFVPVTDKDTRRMFDQTLDLIHYAGSCQRVGRCVRLCIYDRSTWVGGIVLGSTFANVHVRDQALGLKQLVENTRARGIRHPWSRENRAYWSCLQHVVNHARTFIFPPFQGKGLGSLAHRELLRTGVSHWERRYSERVLALDTLCTHPSSKLFLSNGWQLVGRTKGYTSDPDQVFSKRAFREEWSQVRHNIALKRLGRNSVRWWVWVVCLNKKDMMAAVRNALKKEMSDDND